MLVTDKGRAWMEKSHLGSDLKDSAYGCSYQDPPYMPFLAAADLISPPPYRATPLATAILLAACVELYPPRWVCSTS
jgi:hypothetical protein